jgi:hypothetical protein
MSVFYADSPFYQACYAVASGRCSAIKRRAIRINPASPTMRTFFIRRL